MREGAVGPKPVRHSLPEPQRDSEVLDPSVIRPSGVTSSSLENVPSVPSPLVPPAPLAGHGRTWQRQLVTTSALGSPFTLSQK